MLSHNFGNVCQVPLNISAALCAKLCTIWRSFATKTAVQLRRDTVHSVGFPLTLCKQLKYFAEMLSS